MQLYNLYNAVQNNDFTELERLIASPDLDKNQPLHDNGYTILHLFVRTGNIQIIQKLLDEGANINQQDNYGCSALHTAVRLGEIDVIQKLLDEGANIDLQNHSGQSPLHYACFAGRINVIQKLLDEGANIDLQNNYGYTALYIAINFINDKKVIHYLLDSGADPTNLPGELFTNGILSYAVHANYDLKTIKLLLDKGYSNAGVFDLAEEDFCKQISDIYPIFNVNAQEAYTKIKLVKFIHSKDKICKNSNNHRTFFDLITDTDIKDQDLPYTFDQEKVNEIYTELNKHINIPIASQMMDSMNRMTCRKETIDYLDIEYTKYHNNVSSKKTKFRIFELNHDCLEYLRNKLSTSDLLSLLEAVYENKCHDVENINAPVHICIDEVQNEVQVDLNNPNIQVECENYANEIQQEESENNTHVHTMG
ncbi:ankyrin repeat domain-containing protein [Orientia tsutsugamushi]|uniref:ankyrin repeat domain-containing protein n=1 Tax=Orientia tsutsugamushi TaxID=784 RepID=UPI0035286419